MNGNNDFLKRASARFTFFSLNPLFDFFFSPSSISVFYAMI
jgi:hypothetical protein